MKIAVIGPTAPYRGGIAHHGNMVVRTLRGRGHEVDAITFSRQYPKRLYPGAFQEEEGEEFADIRAERLIDSMNPFSWSTTARILREREYDLYLTRFWIPLFGLTFGRIARGVGGGAPGGRVITIIDNLYPHEKRPGDAFLRDYQFRYCNGAITQSGTVHRQFKETYPSIPERMLPHPVYENFGETIDKVEARRRLGLPEGKLILFFGFVRRYKGLDLLLEAMPAILQRTPGVRLCVVGEFFDDPEEFKSIVRRHGLDDSVLFFDRYVPNEEVAEWFSACDLLVLPYRSATNSGIVQIGYNFALPAVVTDVGSLSEVVVHEKTGLVVPDAEPQTLADAVARGLEPESAQKMREGIVDERSKYSWDSFAEGIEVFAETIIGKR